ncbi:putative Cyclin mcs2 [Glarea lozoyensis 74030]|uniref:Putative Cyclin mcs2 n=1 Tax=Glarea lozoyensis (strain ATCC 74030 / MF5533) TaxID=1104152 RepID=H0EFY9_GLAL7|nr:putative Cyclin mcs2 [Glarea lozoyensis 74030]
MTYAPDTILRTALFFATKTENHYFRLSKFAEAIANTKPEDVLASEFLLTQGLRFTFDVRHPFRALEGAVMEMGAMAQGAVPYNESADEELIHWYIASKFGTEDPMAQKILIVLSDCAGMLQTIEPVAAGPTTERKAISALAKKLKKCRNPEKIDLVALQKVKREGDGVEDEKVIKKRKMEREKVAREADELFGPGLTTG